MTAPYRQQVPRPDDARPGTRARWKEVDPARRAHVPVGLVRSAFSSAEAPESGSGAAAAVCVPIAEVGVEASVVMIRRADDLVSDAGHIAFPGGHVEPGETPLDAALRETEEEIGLHRSDIEVIGAFPALSRRVRDSKVAPFVGLVRGRPAFIPDRLEVAEILEVPMASLAADDASWQEVWATGAGEMEMTFFAGIPELGPELVWGLSARILSLLLNRVLIGEQNSTD